ncbi:hypothetical protein TYRP_003929 [Tyrophagus putrescentiae]|nr:hypothetical protein TYRP_003929 [Tyrophagus putrescentiae]
MGEGLADLDLVLLKVHRLLDLCYYIVKGHEKEFYYMAECLAEIETALGRIVEKVGEERFRACLAPVEEEIAKSGRDVRVVPSTMCSAG